MKTLLGIHSNPATHHSPIGWNASCKWMHSTCFTTESTRAHYQEFSGTRECNRKAGGALSKEERLILLGLP